MKVVASRKCSERPDGIARSNRKVLREAGVFTVCVAGGLGCGKTSLIDLTIQHLMPEIHVGVIACDVQSRIDAERMVRHSDQIVQVNVHEGGTLDSSYIRKALQCLDLRWIDVLFIEAIGTLSGTPPHLGQEKRIAVFSVAAGDDQPAKHPELSEAADVIILNKVDLLPAVPFSQQLFRNDVRRLNPCARTFELSALTGAGIESWLKWVRQSLAEERAEAP